MISRLKKGTNLQVMLLAAKLIFVQTAIGQLDKADLLIRNARVVDGSGNPWYRADIALRGNRIAAIGNLNTWQAKTEINAAGQIVAPGFIDVHTHIEDDEAENPLATNFIYDGVTSVITGNCGSSHTNAAAYLRFIDSLRVSVNVGMLLGHNDVRRAVMGRANRPATENELQQMDSIAHAAMRAGALGLSTGLIYIPGSYTPTHEIVRLARVVAGYGGVYATHMRNEGDSVVPAIKEALHIGRQAGIPVQISHFKVSGMNNWGRGRETLQWIKQAREEGLDVTIDQYPYTASSTSLSTLFPDWALADGRDSILARLANPVLRDSIKTAMKANLARRKLNSWTYAVVAYFGPDTLYNGKSIAEINKMLKGAATPDAEAEVICSMMERNDAGMVFHGMSEEDIHTFMQYPFNMFASDASIRIFGRGVPHPRGYGTNARVLGHYVRQKKVIGLEEAIRRMTSLPAQRFGLKDRGLLREGMIADLVIFDEKLVEDASTFEKPHQYSKGFSWVLVNGVITLAEGQHTGARQGEVLYRSEE